MAAMLAGCLLASLTLAPHVVRGDQIGLGKQSCPAKNKITEDTCFSHPDIGKQMSKDVNTIKFFCGETCDTTSKGECAAH